MEQEGDDIHAEMNEEAVVREVRDPGCPTYEERERHNKTHIPFRPWCPICVEAKGKEDPHFLNRTQSGSMTYQKLL